MSETHDVVVLGSGATGLTAALAAADAGASVALFEKADQVGGTSAWSGGMIWIPLNHHMADLGVTDTKEEALSYLESLSNGLIDPTLAEAMVDAGPAVVRWIEASSGTRFAVIDGFPDYHSEFPGARREGGRSLESLLFPFDELGEWKHRVTRGEQLSGNILMGETGLGKGVPTGVPEEELARRRERDERGAGQGLVGGLLKGLLDRGVEPRTNHAATRLLTEDGAVVGVVVEHDGVETEVRARGGVVLATGGFDHDPELVTAFIRGPLERTAAVPTNTGDGLKMAMRVGAKLGNMREAWWVPMVDVQGADGNVFQWQVNSERVKPHTILVNGRGERFVNEGANYNALGAAFHVIDVNTYTYVNHPAYMLFDSEYFRRYGHGGRTFGEEIEWAVKADTIEELAEKLGIDPAALVSTVERWNTHAEQGVDPDYGRGEAATDRWWGDHSYGDSPQATLGPLDTAPYYAVTVRSGALGTKGGPRTDVNGQVVDVDGEVIPGLYAAGNAMASVMGMTYGGAGGTLGPAVVWGYLAGRHAAGMSSKEGAR